MKPWYILHRLILDSIQIVFIFIREENFMGRKILSLLLCGALVSGPVSLQSMTQAESNKPTSVPIVIEETMMKEDNMGIDTMITDNVMTDSVNKEEMSSEKALEAAIKAVKAKLKIPKEYSEFDYYFHGTNTYSNTYWSLNWRNPEEYGYIEVSLDKDNNFISYSKYDQANSGKGIPNYLKKELRDEAEDFIKKIAPDVFKKLEFVEANYDGIYNNSYSYHFQRIEKGVLFPDNTVSVRVNANTGDILSASINWLHGGKIPSSTAKLSKEMASKLIGSNLDMKLTYKTNYYSIFKNGQNETVKKAFLVYEPNIPYISIDANTGEVYFTRSEWVEKPYDQFTNSEKSADMDKGDTAGAPMLTDEEIAKINELEKLITKDKAIEIVTSNQYLHIDKGLMTYTASLNKGYSYKGDDNSYVWYISLRDERPVDYNKEEDSYRAYANASVDAKTGKILSFNASVKNNYDQKNEKWLPVNVKYDKDYGQNVFEKFLKSQINDRLDKSKLVDTRNDYIAYYEEKNLPIYGGYSYQYNRFNEGVEFIYNGIYGSVDGVTGKIYSYNSNWDDDIVFESPKNAITPKKAFEYYISKDGFNLLYEINVINQYDPNYKSKDRYYDYSEAYAVDYEIRLVYRPDINPNYISPFTGEQLDGAGEVYKDAKHYVYKDISDTSSNRELLILSDMNIGFEGENFKPEMVINEGEIFDLLEKLGYWSSDSEKEKASTKLITREELAYELIKRLGLEKVAKLPGIYKTGYKDEDSINSKYLGAVALAKGFDIFSAEEAEVFNPKSNISRRDAIYILLNFVKTGNDNSYK